MTTWINAPEPVIIVSAQLTDWGEKSARQANELAEYMIANFPVDTSRVYAAGYSAGGETMSRAVAMRPDIYEAYIHGGSQWDGEYESVAENRVAVYIFMAEHDEYYGSQKARDAYSGLRAAYEKAGISDYEIDGLLQLSIPDDKWFNDRGVSNYHGGGSIVFDEKDVIDWVLGKQKTEADQTGKGNDLREGGSDETVSTPDDFPAEYYFGSGKISDYSRAMMLKKLPKPSGNETVMNTAADPDRIQVLYLWEEGNAPARTEFTEDMTGYFDDWDFRPYVTAIPVRKDIEPKGALDVARAVRFIRKNADVYGIEPDDIAVMGFSAGGIQAGEFLMHYDEDVNGASLDSGYVTDELDAIPAHASAAGMIYSFYGRLSVGNMDTDWLSEGDLPPTYYRHVR